MTKLPTQRDCAKCGKNTIEVESSKGGTDIGRFTEKYTCSNNNCDATGRISGDASKDTDSWMQRGDIF